MLAMCMQNHLVFFYFGEFRPHSSNTLVLQFKVDIVSIFTPFNFAVLFSPQNLQNKRYTNTQGFTVFVQLTCIDAVLNIPMNAVSS